MDKGIHSIVLVHENWHYFCAQSEITSGDVLYFRSVCWSALRLHLNVHDCKKIHPSIFFTFLYKYIVLNRIVSE